MGQKYFQIQQIRHWTKYLIYQLDTILLNSKILMGFDTIEINLVKQNSVYQFDIILLNSKINATTKQKQF